MFLGGEEVSPEDGILNYITETEGSTTNRPQYIQSTTRYPVRIEDRKIQLENQRKKKKMYDLVCDYS